MLPILCCLLMYYVINPTITWHQGSYWMVQKITSERTRSSKISKEFLLILGNGIVLVTRGFRDLVEPADIHFVPQIRHPWSRNAALKDSVPVDSSEPFMIFNRSAVLNIKPCTSETPSRYLTSGFKSLRMRSLDLRLRKAGNSMIPFKIFW